MTNCRYHPCSRAHGQDCKAIRPYPTGTNKTTYRQTVQQTLPCSRYAAISKMQRVASAQRPPGLYEGQRRNKHSPCGWRRDWSVMLKDVSETDLSTCQEKWCKHEDGHRHRSCCLFGEQRTYRKLWSNHLISNQ